MTKNTSLIVLLVFLWLFIDYCDATQSFLYGIISMVLNIYFISLVAVSNWHYFSIFIYFIVVLGPSGVAKLSGYGRIPDPDDQDYGQEGVAWTVRVYILLVLLLSKLLFKLIIWVYQTTCNRVKDVVFASFFEYECILLRAGFRLSTWEMQ